MTERQKFDLAMATILRADPKAVKAAVDAEIQAHTKERQAKGEQKRGRKRKARNPSASDRAACDKD